jgi:hypothetical protein
MTTTIPTFATEEHTTTESTTDVQAIALDWLVAKDIENAAKPAEKVRKAAGLLLVSLLGRDKEVTVNKGGFRKYVLKVTDVTGRVNADRAVAAMVADGIITEAQATVYLEASRGADYQNVALKPLKV